MAKSQRTTTPPPAPPKADLRVSVGAIALSSGNFDIPLNVRAFLNGQAMTNAEVVFEHNLTKIGQVAIDATTGTANLVCHLPEVNAGRTVNIRVYLNNRPEELTVNVNLPRANQPANSVDPDRISLMNWVSNNGFVCLNLRVIGDRGKALQTTVNLVFEGTNYTVDTNAQGHAYWELPRAIAPNERITIIGTVDGVYKATRLKIWNAAPAAPIAPITSNRIFQVLGGLSVISVILFFISLANVFSGNAVERMKNPSNDLVWALIAVLSLLPIIAFVIYLAWYYLFNGARRVKQDFDYNRTRSGEAHSSDPFLEDAFDLAKNTFAKKETEKSNTFSSASVSGEGTASVKGGYLEGIIDEIIAEITAHGLGSGVKFFFKLFTK